MKLKDRVNRQDLSFGILIFLAFLLLLSLILAWLGLRYFLFVALVIALLVFPLGVAINRQLPDDDLEYKRVRLRQFAVLRITAFIVLGVLPLIYVILRLFLLPARWFVDGQAEQALLDATMAGLAATVFGIAAGIPTAFWLSAIQQQATEAKEKIEEEKERTEREKFILSVIRHELETDRDILMQMIESQATEPGVYPIAGMKNVNWQIFTSTGELKYITDLSLVAHISEAYYLIQALVSLESQYLAPGFDTQYAEAHAASRLVRGPVRIVSHVHSIRPEALMRVKEAIKVIDQKIGSNITHDDGTSGLPKVFEP